MMLQSIYIEKNKFREVKQKKDHHSMKSGLKLFGINLHLFKG